MLCSWFRIGLGWLPILVGIFMGMSIFIPYAISVSLGHVSAGFPYISDTGTYTPESCIFGQLLNITSALAFASIYVRYKQVQEYTKDSQPEIGKWNKVSLFFGCIAALGMSLVANFQELNVLTVHLIGATGCFGLGTVYCFIQTSISYRIHPHFCTQTAYRVRSVLSFLSLIAFVFTMVFASLANQKWDGNLDEKTKWTKDNGGYTEHVLSTTSEWILAFSFLAFFFTFIREFQRIELEAQLKPSTYCLLLGTSPSGAYS
ncbi:DNA damage-regulated autophagy modulator protein 2-like [Anneissia japonica]|uniref:DNA damage-regulated autophagy modulator protein 2-like n=1 Tax=Anneissia japonica TaxID=1529436 RepID=UPI0014256705|nr:DNA damage-regulated autophagy modulator protein 2-like [Anneissia japonica]